MLMNQTILFDKTEQTEFWRIFQISFNPQHVLTCSSFDVCMACVSHRLGMKPYRVQLLQALHENK